MSTPQPTQKYLMPSLEPLDGHVFSLEEKKRLRYFQGLLTNVHTNATDILADAKKMKLGPMDRLAGRLVTMAEDIQELAAISGSVHKERERAKKEEDRKLRESSKAARAKFEKKEPANV